MLKRHLNKTNLYYGNVINNTKLLKGDKTMSETKYTCAVCGKEYDSVEKRAECEARCIKNRKIVEQQRKANEAKEQERASVKAISDELAKADDMIRKHLEKYDSLSLGDKNYYYLSYLFKRIRWCF